VVTPHSRAAARITGYRRHHDSRRQREPSRRHIATDPRKRLYTLFDSDAASHVEHKGTHALSLGDFADVGDGQANGPADVRRRRTPPCAHFTTGDLDGAVSIAKAPAPLAHRRIASAPDVGDDPPRLAGHARIAGGVATE
jgi:hypothetical protein